MKEITIRTNNSVEGVKKIERLWQDVMNGNTELVLTENSMPIAKYSNYDSDENGDYDLSILSCDYNFLNQLEKGCIDGRFKKYDFCSEDLNFAVVTQKTWQQVWDDVRQGRIIRSYTEDYEFTIPANYSQDHKVHCLIYIAIKKNS